MPKGFFKPPTAPLGDALASGPARCGACGLFRGCRSPRMPVTGEGRRGVLVVAEAPGRTEDERGEQLVGDAGQKLRERLRRISVDLDRDCWKTNACCCRPPDNAKPTARQVESCRPNVLRAIATLNPSVIVLCGGTAVESVLGAVWRRSGGVGEVGRWAGFHIPSERWGAWVCPTWHPSYLLHDKDPVLELLFDGHLAAAFGLDGRPDVAAPSDWESQVELAYDPARAADVLRRMRSRGGAVAFDYETNMLKPDHPDARIACCSVCWEGRKTVAFPWVGEAVAAMGELLADPAVRKVGWNMKMEERWSRRAFGRGVEGWDWDGMVASHVLDNRPGITSLKFQAFVRLGVEPYDGAVEGFLKADGGNERNRVDRVDLRDLLTYCGLDSLFTWHIARRQREEVAAEEGLADAYRLFHEGVLTLAEIESAGMRVDVGRLDRTVGEVERRIAELEGRLKADPLWSDWRRAFGERASLGSRPQLAKLLEARLVEAGVGKNEASRRVKVDEDALERLDMPFVRDYLQVERLKKLRSTYLLGLRRETVGDLVRPSFNLHLVKTYRSCVAKGTLIEVVRDVKKFPKGVRIEDVRPGDLVYCYDDDCRLVLRRVLWSGRTGFRRVVRLHWAARGKRGYLDVTPEHKVRLTDGSYRRAVELVGDLRGPADSKHCYKARVLALGRVRGLIFPTGFDAMLDHVFVYGQMNGPIPDGLVVHHVDRNRLNNVPSNLQAMSRPDHSRLHSFDCLTDEARHKGVLERSHNHARYGDRWKSGAAHGRWVVMGRFRLLRLLALAQGSPTKISLDYSTVMKRVRLFGIDLKAMRDRYDRDGKYISRGRLLSAFKSGGRRRMGIEFGANFEKVKRLLRQRGLPVGRRWANQFGAFVPNNHRITGIEELASPVEVYDIEVEGCHNFIAGEICVHNSCDKPNGQNIPKRNEGNAKLVRRCVVPRDGHVLVEHDFGALEFKIAACFWTDSGMVEYASDPALDIHRDMAAECYLLDPKDVPGQVRFFAKNQFVFPTLYGSYWRSTARNLWSVLPGLALADGTPLADHLAAKGYRTLGDAARGDPPRRGTYQWHVKRVEERFCERFPEWAERKERWLERYRARGWFRLMTGFRCRGVYSVNQLYNTPVQGPAFHVNMWSLNRMVEWLKRERMRSVVVGEIHDSMIGDVHRDELDEYLATAERIMTVDVREAWPWIVVPLKVEAEVHERNWYDREKQG